jgi:hypothetical protein
MDTDITKISDTGDNHIEYLKSLFVGANTLSLREYQLRFPPEDHRKCDEIILRAKLYGSGLLNEPRDYDKILEFSQSIYGYPLNINGKPTRWVNNELQALSDTGLFTEDELEKFDEIVQRDLNIDSKLDHLIKDNPKMDGFEILALFKQNAL